METKSTPRSTSQPSLSSKKQRSNVLVSVRLTDAEIAQLQRNKRALSEYARKALASIKWGETNLVTIPFGNK